jgi:chromosome segregation ATPase
LAQLDQRRKDIEEARKRVGEHNAAYPKQEDMQTRAREAVDEKKSIRRAKEQDLKACERRMAELRQQGNRRSGFPPNTDALVKAIAQDTGFHEKPIGPFGSYIQLTEPIWGSILEKSLGGALNAYVVTNKTDQGRLNSIMRRVNWYDRPTMI